ncbi:MAG: hypothetical protein LBS89_08565 [Zoogloeaceae bacterium]|jgi:hypothetical protein|nr:hypothetical protein [Zoogloeaceae bacterium]
MSLLFSHPARLLKLLMLLLLPACTVWQTLNAWGNRHENASHSTLRAAVEWPATWRERPLRPLALSEVEQRFAQGFPGQIARLTDGEHMLIWRHVTQATRMLHPAADCYRAMGWRIRDEQLEQAADHQRWRCFIAELPRKNQRLRVCERIEDPAGQGFTDASAWYWAAVTGQSNGPWQAITVARPW